jgi:hypothetical protein
MIGSVAQRAVGAAGNRQADDCKGGKGAYCAQSGHTIAFHR